MATFLSFVIQFGRQESGQDLIEYALIAGLIGLVAVVGIGRLGTSINSSFSYLSSGLANSF